MPWPGLSHFLIPDPIRAPRRWNVDLVRRGVSPQDCLDWKQVGGVSNGRLRCWAFAGEQILGGESSGFHATESPLHSCRRVSPRARGCSHPSSALAVFPQWQEAIPLTLKNHFYLCWTPGSCLGHWGPHIPWKAHRPQCAWEVGTQEDGKEIIRGEMGAICNVINHKTYI